MAHTARFQTKARTEMVMFGFSFRPCCRLTDSSLWRLQSFFAWTRNIIYNFTGVSAGVL